MTQPVEARLSRRGGYWETSSSGLQRWHKPVPYVPPQLRGCSVFLYKTVDEADQGSPFGGSGCLVGVPSRAAPTLVHLYAVSNEHVARTSPVIRLVRANESSHSVEDRVSDDWIYHGEEDGLPYEERQDLAVCPLGAVPLGMYHYVPDMAFTWTVHLYSSIEVVSVGDECLMVGRYVNHDDKQFDQPVVRFGNLAMLPEPVWQEGLGRYQSSFLVDMRSMAGYSGSPVFVSFGGGLDRIHEPEPGKPVNIDTPIKTSLGPTRLLGINWGHLPAPVRVPVKIDGQSDTEEVEVVGRAILPTGVAAVVPAWAIYHLLNGGELQRLREASERELQRIDLKAAVLDATSAESPSPEARRAE